MQQTVEQTTVPTRTVEVAAEDLPGYIAGLPRLLTEDLTVKVSGDVTSGTDLDLSGFYGGGSLHLVQTDSNAVCSSQLNISHNHILIEIMNFHFVDPNPGSQSARIGVYAANGSLVAIKGCTFSSSAAAESQKYTAVEAYNFADICLENVKASGCGKVVSAGSVCVICVWSARAEDLHDNGVGAHVWYGGTVIIGSGMPDTLGGTSNAKNGGMIVKGDGTLL